jgi:hypothetical protein
MKQSPKGPKRKPRKDERVKRDDEAQSERFIAAARALETSETESWFKSALEKVLRRKV